MEPLEIPGLQRVVPPRHQRGPLPPLHPNGVLTMCKICNDYKEQARAQARIVDELIGQLEAARSTLGMWRAGYADHSASHVYRPPDTSPLPLEEWS